MAQPTNALDRYDLATFGDNAREQFAELIYDISPTECPFITEVGRGSNSNTEFSWQTDSLADPDANNAFIDGDDFAGQARTAAVRLSNYNQISRKEITVTGRADVVNKSGRESELARQVTRAGLELKRDMEAIMTGNQAGRAGNATTAPLSASVLAWLTTNVSRGTSGASGALSNTTHGFPNTAATDGTLRALSETNFLDVHQSAFIEGGNPKMALVYPTVKRRLSNYLFTVNARIATQYQDQGPELKAASVVGSVDYYMSDFGPIQIVPDRFMRNRDMLLIDPEYWSIDYLRSFRVERIAKSGDSEKRMLLADYSLCSKNEASSGVVADIDASAAAVA